VTTKRLRVHGATRAFRSRASKAARDCGERDRSARRLYPIIDAFRHYEVDVAPTGFMARVW
jgi:hypothetical protein